MLQILVVMGLLVRVIHLLPALAGLGATLALIPLSAVVGKLMASVRREMVGHTDARVKLATEVITGERAPPAGTGWDVWGALGAAGAAAAGAEGGVSPHAACRPRGEAAAPCMPDAAPRG